MQAQQLTHGDSPPTRDTAPTGRAVVVAASSTITRWGLRALIDHADELHLADEFATLDAVAAAAPNTPEPTILLLGSSVTTPLDRLQDLSNYYTVVVFVETDDVAIGRLLRAGVRGLVDRRDDVTTVTATLMAVCSGVTAVGPYSLEHLLNNPTHTPTETPRAPLDSLNRLGGREREVLACLGQGWSNRQISSYLHLTEGTVKGYVSVILSKLGLSNRTAAALQACSWDLQKPEQVCGHSNNEQ